MEFDYIDTFLQRIKPFAEPSKTLHTVQISTIIIVAIFSNCPSPVMGCNLLGFKIKFFFLLDFEF